MHFFNKLNLFKPSSSPRDAQSAGEVGTDIPASKSNSASRSRRRLKRRSTKPVEAIRRQPQEPIPDHRNAGFRSAPDLLAEAHVGDSQSQSWSPIPSLQRKSAPADASIRFGETFSDGRSWKSYERKASSIDYLPNARPPLDEQLEDSPVFGPREEGLFREEMPYDMLASGWRESPRYMSRTTPPDDSAAQWSYSPKSRPISPLRHTPEPVVDGTYYIVPGGTNVVFQDEDGNEITRVGDFTGRRRRISPIIVQDEFGRELYRYGLTYLGMQFTICFTGQAIYRILAEKTLAAIEEANPVVTALAGPASKNTKQVITAIPGRDLPNYHTMDTLDCQTREEVNRRLLS
ncbi:hypothetical protein B0H11DRAFT_1902766 [Mycena galericulata]|nr:hypothetical protein B0H11DRAFT_1902766 [Mycena galericulata]